MGILSREPGGKAQLVSAATAFVVYLLQKQLRLLPEEADLLAPLVAYVVAQVVTWLWARGLTTPVDDPSVPTGSFVRTYDPVDGSTGPTTRV